MTKELDELTGRDEGLVAHDEAKQPTVLF